MATITLEEITNELLGNPPSSTNFDNTIEDDDPIDSSQYTQEDLDYWQEQEDKRNTIKEQLKKNIPLRILYAAEGFRQGLSLDNIHQLLVILFYMIVVVLIRNHI